jgi:hypothetical protein
VRTTQGVFEDHLRLRKQDDPESDIERNYAEDAVVMSNFGIFHGRDGVRRSEQLLHEQLLSGRHYTYVQCLTDQEIAFEKWDGSSANTQVKDGIDFFVIRNGYIQLQLIYYAPCEPLFCVGSCPGREPDRTVSGLPPGDSAEAAAGRGKHCQHRLRECPSLTRDGYSVLRGKKR